jgi:D-aspartate ligase
MNLNPRRSEARKVKPGAIVLGGNFVGLGVARSLGAHGIPVWVVDADRSKSIAQFSRYTKRFFECKENLVEFLLREGRQHDLRGWVVFPTTDESVEMVSANHELLSSVYQIAAPPAEITQFALDKRLTYGRAAELGIATPWTATGNHPSDIEDRNPPYPLILKPAVNHHFFPHTNVKALPVENSEELHQRFAQMCRYISADSILAQERIPGDGENQFSYCALCRNGKVIASLGAQRRRQYPIEFGNASTFVQTVEQPVVESSGRRFLESIGYDGIGEIEFKFDPRDSQYKILDANLRPWGWHTLGKAAGINFAYLLWQQKTGIDVASITKYRKAAWVREITDVVAIAKSRNRFAEIKTLLSAWASGKFTLATFSVLDPLPFFAELFLWASSGISRQRKAQQILQPKLSVLEVAQEAEPGLFSAGVTPEPVVEMPADDDPTPARKTSRIAL